MAKKKTSKNKPTTQSAITGNVTVKVLSGKRVVKTYGTHNCATDNMFYGLILALAKNLNTGYLPTFIGVGTGKLPDGTLPASLSALTQEIQINRPLVTLFRSPNVDRVKHQASCTFQGIIPYAAVGSSIIREIGIFGTQTGNSLLARIEFKDESDPDAGITLQSGQSLVIEWIFSITNANNNYQVPIE